MLALQRAQAKRKEKVKLRWDWLRPTLGAAIVLCSAAGLSLMLDWMRDAREWPVRTVQVEGRFQHLDKARLQDAVLPLAEAGFFALDVARVQARIQAMPWVDQVSVRRVWPDRLMVQVIEQRPVARWGERGLLNARAQLFEPEEPVELAQLPRLAGPAGYEQRVLQMHGRMQELLNPLQQRVVDLRLDARRTWTVELSNGVTVDIGRTDAVDRLERFVRVYPAILAAGKGAVTSVDLRYSNGFAVLWRQADDANGTTG